MRSEVCPPVIRMEPKAADDLVLEPEQPGAGQVAHGRGEDAVLQRGAAGVRADGQPDFIGRIAALRHA